MQRKRNKIKPKIFHFREKTAGSVIYIVEYRRTVVHRYRAENEEGVYWLSVIQWRGLAKALTRLIRC
jgi:hypothetical protein